MISAAGRMSLTLLTETPAHSGAYSMSPSKSGGAVPIDYRIHSMRSPMVLERWPIDVPSPGFAPRGGHYATACARFPGRTKRGQTHVDLDHSARPRPHQRI